MGTPKPPGLEETSLLIGSFLILTNNLTPRYMATPRVVSDCWFVRVDGVESFLRQKCGELSRWIDVSICHGVYHAGASKENPHTHIIIKLLGSLQKQSFDIRIKKLFEVEKRSQYSTKLWDGNYGEGAGSYLYHESNDSPVLCSKGLTELHIQQFKDANASVQKVVALNKAKANTKLIDFAMEEFQNASWNNYDMEKDIFMYMLKRCKDGLNYYPGDGLLKRYVQEVHLKLCPDQNFEGYAESAYNRIWRL